MQMGSSGATRTADSAQNLAAPDLLSREDIVAGEMCVITLHAISMVDDYQPAIAAAECGVTDDSVGGSSNRRSLGSRDIDAGVVCALTREGILTVAKAAHQ